MGYYTYFSIYDVSGPEEAVCEFEEFMENLDAIEKIVNNNSEGLLFYKKWSFEELLELDDIFYYLRKIDRDALKWYSFSEDMQKFSKLFPTVTIIINGIDENGIDEKSNDCWREKFLNGISNRVNGVIVYPEFSF